MRGASVPRGATWRGGVRLDVGCIAIPQDVRRKKRIRAPNDSLFCDPTRFGLASATLRLNLAPAARADGLRRVRVYRFSTT